MMNKKIILIICILSCLIFQTACNNSNNKNNNVDDKSTFVNNIENIVKSIENDESIHNLDFEYFQYAVSQNSISNMFGFEYDISDYNIENGAVAKNADGDIYASFTTSEYCAIKGFSDNAIKVYNISEKEKCYKFHIIGDNMRVSIDPYNLETTNLYQNGTISDGYIVLSALDNLVDNRFLQYTWYRNNEKIENSNVSNYYVTLDQEDADYYVEITIPTGEVYKSEPVNVKINRK